MQQITARELQEWLADGSRDNPLLLDVRESWEVEICCLPECVHIPMFSVPDRHSELMPEREIVVVCHRGARSMQVADFLDRNGFAKVYNLTGGVAAWAEEVDPSMATY